MKTRCKIFLITSLVAIIYTALIAFWHFYTPNLNLKIQEPGLDNRPEGTARNLDEVIIGEFFMNYEDEPSNLIGKWANFRGENQKNIIQAKEKINISANHFPKIWSVETGEGHAAPVIYNGKVYFLDYNENLNSDALRCFSLTTGNELWRRWYRVPMKRNHGFSRTIPAVGENYIVTIGPEGHVMCCNPNNGDLLWSLDMKKEYKIEIPPWYTGQCPLVENDVLILAPAGEETLLMGLDVISGKVLWQTPNSVKFKMSHSSVMPMNINGKKMFVYIGVGGICGVSAEVDDKGKLLWSETKWQPNVVAPSPLQISANQILMVAGYGAGGAVLQIDGSGNSWSAKITEQHKANEGLASEQQTPIIYNNLIYTILPKDGGENRERLVVYSPANLKNPLWISANDEKFGLGPYLIINNYLFAFKDNGELFVFDVSSKQPKLIKKQKIIEGIDAWGPIAYADGFLIVRDAHFVKCLKIN